MRDKKQRKHGARFLRSQGWSTREIAKLLGVCHETIRHWTDPKAAADHKRRGREYREANRERCRGYQRQYAETPRGRMVRALRASRLLARKNGYEPCSATVDELLVSDYSACAICGVSDSGDRSLNMDHCHVTGEFRGWLCGNCNSGLGQFQDRTDLLLKAAEYLNGDACNKR